MLKQGWCSYWKSSVGKLQIKFFLGLFVEFVLHNSVCVIKDWVRKIKDNLRLVKENVTNRLRKSGMRYDEIKEINNTIFRNNIYYTKKELS